MLCMFQLIQEEEDQCLFFDLTYWFQADFTHSFLFFLNYLGTLFGHRLWMVTIEGYIRTRHNLPRIPYHTFHSENQNFIVFNEIVLDLCCCYCGRQICLEPHPDIKLLEIWCKPLSWMCFGYDLFISHPQETKIHTSGQTEYLIYIIDFPMKKVLMYNDTTEQLYPAIYQNENFLEYFPGREKTKVLSLKTWALRGLVKGRLDLSHLTHHLPYPSLKPFEKVGKCLKEVGKWPHPLEIFTLHHIAGLM